MRPPVCLFVIHRFVKIHAYKPVAKRAITTMIVTCITP